MEDHRLTDLYFDVQAGSGPTHSARELSTDAGKPRFFFADTSLGDKAYRAGRCCIRDNVFEATSADGADY